MRVNPLGCLLTVLAVLALLALGVAWIAVFFLGAFNDNGAPDSTSWLTTTLQSIEQFGTAAVLVGVLGALLAVAWPWWRNRRLVPGASQAARPLGGQTADAADPVAGTAPPMEVDAWGDRVPAAPGSPSAPANRKLSGMPLERAVLVFGGLLMAGVTLPTGCFRMMEWSADRDQKRINRQKEELLARIRPRLIEEVTRDGTLSAIPCPDDMPTNLYPVASLCFASPKEGDAVGETYRKALLALKVDEMERHVRIGKHEGSSFNYIPDPRGRGDWPDVIKFRMEYVSRSSLNSGTYEYLNTPSRRAWWAAQTFNTFLAVEPDMH